MIGWLTFWWVWITAALVLGIVELLAPGFIFLGFALGALTIGLTTLIAPDLLSGLGFNALMALFAGLSLLAWIALKRAFRKQSSGAQVFTDDVND